ncbi:MAG TPA: hypothetical protein VFD27_03535 [Chthoniobacteraceae bacterium]|nr:hypothetical protein [Chthoniobacteraceae bacterium]
MSFRNFIRYSLIVLLLLAASRGFGQTTAPSRAWNYVLLEGSELTDDCLICGRPTISAPMRGSFRLRLLEVNPLFARYAVEDLKFFAGSAGGLQYRVTGSGTYQFGGEVALQQEMALQVVIDDGYTARPASFDSGLVFVSRPWPMIAITLPQTDGTPTRTYTLQVNAAPLREIWFSTLTGFHAGVAPQTSNYISPGDLISSAGRVVKRNHELTARLGVMPSVPDLGLDAVDILPGGEIIFSIEYDIFSETLGPLHHGDILSAKGRIVRSYASLIGAFSPQPPVADQGLDAVQLVRATELATAKEFLFSIEQDFFSESLGRTIRRGDLLSSLGQVAKTNAELLARFSPTDAQQDYGLDAVYVWPSGEIWFSTEKGFTGPNFAAYGPGDLLSDQGYVVYRNLELVGPFQPIEDASSFGLDALFVITDATPRPPTGRFTAVERANLSVRLSWEGEGRVFQINRASQLPGSWLPVSPIMPDQSFTDPEAIYQQSQGFYQLQQW